MKPLLTTLSSVLLVLILLAGASGAHEILGPPVVQANGSGSFAYEITVVISDPIEFAYCELNNLQNTDVESYHADGFCMTVIQPGTFKELVEGKLLDRTQDGNIQYFHALCDGWNGEVTTRIVAPPVDSASTTWSAIKSTYR